MSHSKKEMISFFLTTKCNLSCIYCYTNKREHKHQTLSLEFAKAGIDDYFKTSYKKHLRFFGAGEPTTELDLIKEIKSYAQSLTNEEVTAEIQTNGCFSDETAKWLGENIDVIWISSDGTPEMQDYYRPTISGGQSSIIMEKNIKYLIENGKGMTGIRTTITDQNVKEQIKNIDYFYNLGIRNIWVDPIFPAVGEEIIVERLDMMEFAKEFLNAGKYATTLGIKYGSILTCNFDEKSEYSCRACLPVPHLTSDGYVSACDMALFGEDVNHMSPFIYGKWDEETKKIEYYQDKIDYLRSRKVDNISHCKQCSVKEYCCGYCLGEVMNETKDLFGHKKRVCGPIRYLYENMEEEQKHYTYTHP